MVSLTTYKLAMDVTRKPPILQLMAEEMYSAAQR
jgi:hypothetical protein